jgi:phosphoribosylglycinamide formyltransferase 1
MTQGKRIVVLISGRGSNFIALHQSIQRDHWPHQLCAVISNVPTAGGLQYASAQAIAQHVVDPLRFASRQEFELALQQAIDNYAPDVLVLAGFMRVLSPAFVSRYEMRILNIHPSLLPAFAGLHTHRRALQAGVKLHGATVHLVTADVDSGPILAQAALCIANFDGGEEELAKRVLQLEHQLYPRTIRAWLDGAFTIHNGIAKAKESFASLLFVS